MNLRVTIIMLLLSTATANELTQTNEHPDLVRTLSNLFEAVRDIFYIIFGKEVMFRHLLSVASGLVSAWLPQDPVPVVPERWWGDDQRQGSFDTSIRPFKVHFSEKMISDLRFRIHNRRNITASLRDVGISYGTNSDQLKQFLDHWANKYDFKKREEFLNHYPQYITNIQGLNIHFIHVKPTNPSGKKIVPLLLLHGWPNTAYEFFATMEHLLVDRQDSKIVFEIVAPHLPGFGYSEATNKVGMANYQMGIIIKNLMDRIGLPQFYIHSGGLGQLVADKIAILFPDKVLGLHTHFAFSMRPQTLVKWLLGQFCPRAVVDPRYENRLYPLSTKSKFYIENFGYLHMHASRPDNIGHGAEDSPVAQASWFQPWFDTYDPEFWYDAFTVYWDAQCMVTSMRAYAESLAFFQDPLTRILEWSPTPVPVASTHFPDALIYQPPGFIRDKYPNLVQVTMLDVGGHFAAGRSPGALADAIRIGVDKMELFHEKKFRYSIHNGTY